MSRSGAATELYQKAVLDHNRSPRHYGTMDFATHRARGRNPICGDEVFLFLNVQDGRLSQVQFTAQSCALCRASASMMCEDLSGLKLDAIHTKVNLFRAMLTGAGELVAGESSCLAVTKDFPARAKCVLLPWQTFVGALSGQVDISTEPGEE